MGPVAAVGRWEDNQLGRAPQLIEKSDRIQVDRAGKPRVPVTGRRPNNRSQWDNHIGLADQAPHQTFIPNVTENKVETQLGAEVKVAEAENFMLRGPDGSERGKMGTSPEGHPYLVLLERSGRPRVALGRLYGHASREIEGQVITYGSGPSEGYYDKDGKPRSTVPYSQWLKERTTYVQKPGEPAESVVVIFDGSGNVA